MDQTVPIRKPKFRVLYDSSQKMWSIRSGCLLTLRRESHLFVILQLPSHLLITLDFGETALASAGRVACSKEGLADLMRYMFSLATRRLAVTGEVDGRREGEGEVRLLAAADMILVSLLPCSIDRCRRKE